tara:strand:- start:1738 stop:2247 length:510 start_codon:yes stop_codon:yes gene_type:complete
MSNLRLVKEYTTSVAASTLTYNDLFTEDFDCYMVTMTGKAASSAAGGHLRVVNPYDGILRIAQYNWSLRYMKGNAGDGDLKADGATDWANCAGVYDTTGGESVWYIFNPYDSSKYTYFIGINATTTSGDSRAYRYGGCFTNQDSITGLSLAMDNTMTGTIRSYGLRVDV